MEMRRLAPSQYSKTWLKIRRLIRRFWSQRQTLKIANLDTKDTNMIYTVLKYSRMYV